MANDGKYITLQIAPTVNKDNTEYRAEGAWADSQNIRFHHNRPAKRNGYISRGLSQNFTGVARDIRSWKELNNVTHFAVGTHLKLQIEQLGTVYDITPVSATTTVTNSLNTSSGSLEIIASVAGHNRTAGDYFIVSADTTVGGVDFNGNEYVVTSVISNDAFTFDASTTADATSAQAGGDVVYTFLLPSGRQSNGAAYGYGAGTWNTPGTSALAGYNEPRGGDGITAKLRQWSLDVWGEDLIACRRGGNVFVWDATTSVQSRAVRISAAPVSNNIAFVHPNRHLVLLGTHPVGESTIDPLEIRWSDRENYNEFAVSAGTRAGSYRLQGGGNEIVGYTKSKREVIIFTDDTVWSMRALNNNAVFGFEQVGTNTGLVAQHAAVDVDGISYWMSNNNFYKYDGRVQHLESDVEDYVFDRIDRDQIEKTFCGVNKDFEEIIWLYQSTESDEIDSYVKFNWDLGSWDVGTVDRVVWEDSTVFDNPLGVDQDGTTYNEESAVDADTSAMKSYLESSYFDIGDGTEMFLLDQFIPDFTLTGQLNFTVTTQKWPNGPEVVKGPYTILPGTKKIDLRARGRQMKVRFSTSALGTDWEIGKPRYRIRPDGER